MSADDASVADGSVAALPARVMSVGRNAVWIVFDDEAEARVAALRKSAGGAMLVPGDRVRAHRFVDGTAFVDRVEPREFALRRKTGGGRTKTMAANIDGIAIVAAFAQPPLHLPMVDELLAFSELHGLGARVLFTKPDLAQPGEPERIASIYARIAYPALLVNPRAGAGVEAVRRELTGHRTLLVGQSGVGKSTLFGALGGSAIAGELSRIGRGRQTTTAARLHRFADGGFLIDSPGIAEFGLDEVSPDELASAFVEFRLFVRHCRFTDCTHRSEPDCAVRAAVERGEIAESRYASYRRILTAES